MRNTGKQIRAVPTWTQAEREKTDIPVRNTLSQLHWLHHSVNTQHRQAVIANIWRVWVYKKWTKAPAAVARLCVFTVWRRPGIRFPPPYTLWPRDIHWVSPVFFPTNRLQLPSLTSNADTPEGSGIWRPPEGTPEHPLQGNDPALRSRRSLLTTCERWASTVAMPTTATQEEDQRQILSIKTRRPPGCQTAAVAGAVTRPESGNKTLRDKQKILDLRSL